jgi:hypothetical protein
VAGMAALGHGAAPDFRERVRACHFTSSSGGRRAVFRQSRPSCLATSGLL